MFFIVLQCFLSSIEYAKLHNTLLSRFKTFEKHLHTVPVDLFLSELDFLQTGIKQLLDYLNN